MCNVYDYVRNAFAIVGVYKNGVDVTADRFNYFDKNRKVKWLPFEALERYSDILRKAGYVVTIEY